MKKNLSVQNPNNNILNLKTSSTKYLYEKIQPSTNEINNKWIKTPCALHHKYTPLTELC